MFGLKNLYVVINGMAKLKHLEADLLHQIRIGFGTLGQLITQLIL